LNINIILTEKERERDRKREGDRERERETRIGTWNRYRQISSAKDIVNVTYPVYYKDLWRM